MSTMPLASRQRYARTQAAKRKAARRADRSTFSYVTAERYWPLDEILALPRVRILRAVSRHEWLFALDLARELLGDCGMATRNAHDTMCSRLVRGGFMTSRRNPRGRDGMSGVEYQITATGLGELRRALARAVVPAPAEDSCSECCSRKAVRGSETCERCVPQRRVA